MYIQCFILIILKGFEFNSAGSEILTNMTNVNTATAYKDSSACSSSANNTQAYNSPIWY